MTTQINRLLLTLGFMTRIPVNVDLGDVKAEELNRMLPGIDYVTFASSSAVKAYASMVEDLSAMKGKYISIGPVTTKTAERLGLKVAGTAAVYTARGMVETMIQDAANDSNGK